MTDRKVTALEKLSQNDGKQESIMISLHSDHINYQLL